MNTLMHSEIFFFISSVGFIILWVLAAILITYVIRTMDTFSRLMEKIEKNVDSLGEEAHDVLDDIKESAVFRFLFPKKSKAKKSRAKKSVK